MVPSKRYGHHERMASGTISLLPPLSFAFIACFICLSCVGQTSPKRSVQDPASEAAKALLSGETPINENLPENQRAILPSEASYVEWSHRHNLKSFGWVDGGATTISDTSGLVTEAPVLNRFSNQFMLNQAWLVIERLTNEKALSWGFRYDFYVGSDAARLRSLDYFGPSGERWGTEIRQGYVSVHTPNVFSKDVEWIAGRVNFPTGAETTLSAYQPLYSRSYFWIHGETSGTALLATVHADPRVDVTLGTTMGYGTTFVLRGRAPNYLAGVHYRPASLHKQEFIATVYSGPKPIAATNNHAGTWQTLAELQARESWTARFSQIYQVSYIADPSDPGNGGHNSGTQGAFVLSKYELSRKVTLQTRLEWFSDPHGTRVAIPGVYSEATLGVTFRPKPWIEFRPEIRGDFSGQSSFGSADTSVQHRNQFSEGFEVLIKGKLF
jgi:hypothetical protein